MKKAIGQTHDPNAVWTDGSRLSSGGVGVRVAWYEEVAEDEPPVITRRRGSSKAGTRRGDRTHLWWSVQVVQGDPVRVENCGFRFGYWTQGLRCGASGDHVRAYSPSGTTARRGRLYDLHGFHGLHETSGQRWSRTGPEHGDTDYRARAAICRQGNCITIRWTPAHREVEGNERADQKAKEMASQGNNPELQPGLPAAKGHREGHGYVEGGHSNQKRRPKGLPVTYGRVSTMHQAPASPSP